MLSRLFFKRILLTDDRRNAVCANFQRWMSGEGCPKANGERKKKKKHAVSDINVYYHIDSLDTRPR